MTPLDRLAKLVGEVLTAKSKWERDSASLKWNRLAPELLAVVEGAIRIRGDGHPRECRHRLQQCPYCMLEALSALEAAVNREVQE